MISGWRELWDIGVLEEHMVYCTGQADIWKKIGCISIGLKEGLSTWKWEYLLNTKAGDKQFNGIYIRRERPQ